MDPGGLNRLVCLEFGENIGVLFLVTQLVSGIIFFGGSFGLRSRLGFRSDTA